MGHLELFELFGTDQLYFSMQEKTVVLHGGQNMCSVKNFYGATKTILDVHDAVCTICLKEEQT